MTLQEIQDMADQASLNQMVEQLKGEDMRLLYGRVNALNRAPKGSYAARLRALVWDEIKRRKS